MMRIASIDGMIIIEVWWGYYSFGVVTGYVDGEGKVGLGCLQQHNNLANKPLVN